MDTTHCRFWINMKESTMLLPGMCLLSFSGSWIERRSSATVDPFGFHVGELGFG